MIAGLAETCLKGGIGNVQNGVESHIACRGRLQRRFENTATVLLANGFIGKGAHRTAGKQLADGLIHKIHLL